MKKFTALFFMSLSFFVLTGCVRIDINQTIARDGSSHMDSSIDITALNQMKKSAQNSLSGSTIQTSFTGTDNCWESKASTSENPYITNLTCSKKTDDIFVISSNVEALKNNWITMSGGVYIYDLRKVEKILEGDKVKKQENGSIFLSGSKDPIKDPRAMGFKYTYSLTMPGDIVYADIGTISGSTITMDYFDVIKLKTAYVVSKDPGISLTLDQAKALLPEGIQVNQAPSHLDIKILTPLQQKQINESLVKMNYSRLDTISRVILAKKTQMSQKKKLTEKDMKNIDILSDVLILIWEHQKLLQK